jgi:hypothetical protein
MRRLGYLGGMVVFALVLYVLIRPQPKATHVSVWVVGAAVLGFLLGVIAAYLDVTLQRSMHLALHNREQDRIRRIAKANRWKIGFDFGLTIVLMIVGIASNSAAVLVLLVALVIGEGLAQLVGWRFLPLPEASTGH